MIVVENVVTSVVNAAAHGSTVAVMLNELLGRVSTRSDRITVISNDLAINSLLLEQLGRLMRSNLLEEELCVFNKYGMRNLTSSIHLFNDAVDSLSYNIENANQKLNLIQQPIDGRVALSRDEIEKWPLLQPSVEIIQVELQKAKPSFMLFYQLHRLVNLKNVAKWSVSCP